MFSCKSNQPQQVNYEYSKNVHNVINGEFTKNQLDSILIEDTISVDLNNWLSAPFVDYETKEQKVKYMFVKDNGNYRTTYILYNKNNKYNLIKRVG